MNSSFGLFHGKKMLKEVKTERGGFCFDSLKNQLDIEEDKSLQQGVCYKNDRHKIMETSRAF